MRWIILYDLGISPNPKDVIRHATFIIRQQQYVFSQNTCACIKNIVRFREICEDASAAKALNFLQTEVSSTVDHQDPQESEIFRTLLTHLLSPSSSLFEATEMDIEQFPPRKRSRPNTPEDSTVRSPKPQDSVTADLLLAIPDSAEENKQTAYRFKQRTEIFESLLEFISDDAKQPAGSLLDFIDRDLN